MWKNETMSKFLTIHKQVQMDGRPLSKLKILKLLEQNTSRHRHGQGFPKNDSNIVENTFKNWQVGLREIRLLYRI